MVHITKYILFYNAFLFWSAEKTLSTFLVAGDDFYHRDRTSFFIYRTVFFDQEYKKMSISDKNVFFFKLYFLWTKNYRHNIRLLRSNTPTVKVNKRLINIFNKSWFRIFQFCNNFLFNFFLSNMKMLVLDSNYKNYYYFLSHHLNKVDFADNFEYFFPTLKNFSKRNWFFFFARFCKKKNITALFVSDTALVKNNLHSLVDLGLPIIAFLVHGKNNYVDYSFFSRVRSNDFYYLLSSVFLNYAFFMSLNYKLDCYKFIYIKMFGNIFLNELTEETYLIHWYELTDGPNPKFHDEEEVRFYASLKFNY